MQIHFSGKTAIVTGAAHGFGRAISIGLQSLLGLHRFLVAERLKGLAVHAGRDQTPAAANINMEHFIGPIVVLEQCSQRIV